jgi:hypothetical protein
MATTTISEAAVSLKIRAVMLDYGEVLSFVPSPDAIARMARVFRIDPSSFLPIYIQSRGPYDRGDLLPEEYWHAFASRAGVQLREELRALGLPILPPHIDPQSDS